MSIETPKSTSSDLRSVLAPIETANGLSNNHYVNAATHEAEKQLLFKDGWAAIGFGKDVPRPGCVYPLEFMGIPLLMTRDKNNNVHVFENICRHRGMILVSEAKRLSGPITCPYHAWAYDLEGNLRATPHAGGPDIHNHSSVPCDQLPLNEVRATVWRDVVFVNLSGTAEPFELFAADLIERWAEFEQPVFWGGEDSSFELTVECNWKLAVENYCEAYHLPFIHPALNSYSRLQDHYNILSSDNYAGQGTMVYNPSLSEDGRSFHNFADLSEKWDTGAEYCALFPNVLLGVHRDHAFAIVLLPQTQEQTIERITLYYADEAALTDTYADMRETNAAMWKDIFVEDIGVVEGMQKGRHSLSYDGGKFSAVMDAPTHHFHRWVASEMHKANQ